jgi:hypothetical protein
MGLSDYTIREYAFFPAPPEQPVFGLLFVEYADGSRWTLRGEPELLQLAIAASGLPEHVLAGATLGGVWERCPWPGWPDEWSPEMLIAFGTTPRQVPPDATPGVYAQEGSGPP